MHNTKNVASAACLALALAAMPIETKAQEHQNPIVVGVIDTDASALHDPKKAIFVEKRSFLADGDREASHRTITYREHGADVMSAFIEQSRAIDPSRPIKILSAIAFLRSGDNPIDELKNRPMKLDLAAATKALEWFKEQGVRTVVTAFVVPDSPRVQAFMKRASELNMVVFSATNNVSAPYDAFPARHPYAISVTGNGRNLDFDTNIHMQKWVMFQSSANIPGKTQTVWPENGSSYAVSRVAAFGAHLVDKNPSMSRDEVVVVLRTVSASSSHGVPSLAGSKSTENMKSHMDRVVYADAERPTRQVPPAVGYSLASSASVPSR